jgi:hypothetical protein
VTGAILQVDGWSWIVEILPEMEHEGLWETLNTKPGLPPPHGFGGRPLIEWGTQYPKFPGGTPHENALNTVIAELHCPSYQGSRYVVPDARRHAITNYKVVSATHMGSLTQAFRAGTGWNTVPGGPQNLPWTLGYPGVHPDGAIYPGSTLKVDSFKRDGTAHSILAVETYEPQQARWTVGIETLVVGLPQNVTYTKNLLVGTFWAPTYFNGKFDEEGGIQGYWSTYLGYTPNDWLSDPYPHFPVLQSYLLTTYIPSTMGIIPSNNDPLSRYVGPGSRHPGVTNHLFVDATARSINNNIDPALYMFLITRDGGDPTGYFFSESVR